MAWWLVREERAPVVIVELLEEATQRQKAAGWRPPLLVKRPVRATPQRALLAWPE